MTKLYIARHGETMWNIEKRLQGHMDSPLTELGVNQAGWLAEALREVHFDQIYASSSARAYRTAELIRLNRDLNITSTDDLKEMNLGDWEGRLASELEVEFPELFHQYWRTPHLYVPVSGESYTDVQKRVDAFVATILSQHQDQSILLVTHTVTLKLIMAYFEKRSLPELWNSPYIHPACLCLVEADVTDSRILLHGDTSHYQEQPQSNT
jgi:broad specificity phosphatase PhoE